jgi:hypothetical protein
LRFGLLIQTLHVDPTVLSRLQQRSKEARGGHQVACICDVLCKHQGDPDHSCIRRLEAVPQVVPGCPGCEWLMVACLRNLCQVLYPSFSPCTNRTRVHQARVCPCTNRNSVHQASLCQVLWMTFQGQLPLAYVLVQQLYIRLG